MSDALAIFRNAIDEVGGPLKAEGIVGRKQPTISGYLKDGNAPAEVCMRLELATEGKYRAEQMRPDLADVFERYRDKPTKRSKREA